MQEEPTPMCEWHEGYEYDNCEPCETAWEAWADLQVDRALEDRYGDD